MKFVVIFSLLLLFCSSAQAGCWVVNSLEGYSATQSEEYKISADDLYNQNFVIYIRGKEAKISGSDKRFIAVSPTIALGVDEDTVETWSIDPQANRVIYTRNRSDSSRESGAKLLIGKILKTC